MSTYVNDPRVQRQRNGDYLVDRNEHVTGTVHDCGGPNPWVVSTNVGHPLQWFPTADEAIRSLIGDPQ